jgi:hypothetical protein
MGKSHNDGESGLQASFIRSISRLWWLLPSLRRILLPLLHFICDVSYSSLPCKGIVLGTSVHKIDGFALDCFIFLGAMAFKDDGIQGHFLCLSASCRRACCSSSLSEKLTGRTFLSSTLKTQWYAERNLFKYYGLSLEALKPLFGIRGGTHPGPEPS